MEQERPPVVHRRMSGVRAFTVGAIAGSISEMAAPDQFGDGNLIYTSLVYGAIGGGIILPMFQRVVPPYSLGERSVFTTANATGLLTGIMLVRAMRQYLQHHVLRFFAAGLLCVSPNKHAGTATCACSLYAIHAW